MFLRHRGCWSSPILMEIEPAFAVITPRFWRLIIRKTGKRSTLALLLPAIFDLLICLECMSTRSNRRYEHMVVCTRTSNYQPSQHGHFESLHIVRNKRTSYNPPSSPPMDSQFLVAYIVN